MNVCVVITVAMVMLSRRDFGPYGIILMTVCVFAILDFPVILGWQFTSLHIMSRFKMRGALYLRPIRLHGVALRHGDFMTFKVLS
jgi:hypothetical protein